MLRIVVIDYDKCNLDKCGYFFCERVCFVNRMGGEVIIIDEENYCLIIQEVSCMGCGICVYKCLFNVIMIVNFLEEFEEGCVYCYGINVFVFYCLLVVKEGMVVGVFGLNGIGKMMVVKIFLGQFILNFCGNNDNWDNVIKVFCGNEFQNYFEKFKKGEIRFIVKLQYVDFILKVVKGKVRDLFKKVDEIGKFDEVVKEFEFENILDREIQQLLGGELQRVVIVVVFFRNVYFYFFDEFLSYFDIRQRFRIVKIIRRFVESGKNVFIVEYDLVLFDYMSDIIYVVYGKLGVYGIFFQFKLMRNGINEFFRGYLRDENVCFRFFEIIFIKMGERKVQEGEIFVQYLRFVKEYENGFFRFEVEGGEFYVGEVVGIVGLNGIGKMIFVKMFVGVEKFIEGEVDWLFIVSYKFQYIKMDYEGIVFDFLSKIDVLKFMSNFYKIELFNLFGIFDFYDRQVNEFFGGELQRVVIIVCLIRDVDIYFIDEFLVYFDVEQRLVVLKVICLFMVKNEKIVLIVEYDVMMVDYFSDCFIVFEGELGELRMRRQC